MSVALNPDHFYHIYNRANGNEQLFTSKENYRFFLKRYIELICPVADTYAYCLMPNHFHFLVKIKSINSLRALLEFKTDEKLPQLVSKKLSNLFSSYTQAYNKQQDRMGSLFMKNFKGKQIEEEVYLRKLVHYIHFNPIAHGCCNSLRKWNFSSYNTMISTQKTMVKRQEVLEFFDDLEKFKFCHEQPPKLSRIE